MELFGNTLKNSDRDSVPIPSPLTDSFELEFRTDVVTCETRSSEFFWNLEVSEYSDEVRRFASLPRTVYLVIDCIQISDLVILSQRINFQISDLVIRVIAGDPVLECIWDDPRPSTINTGPIIDGIIQV